LKTGKQTLVQMIERQKMKGFSAVAMMFGKKVQSDIFQENVVSDEIMRAE
jgi:hypothetical protein